MQPVKGPRTDNNSPWRSVHQLIGKGLRGGNPASFLLKLPRLALTWAWFVANPESINHPADTWQKTFAVVDSAGVGNALGMHWGVRAIVSLLDL
jgi:hypothetical protein